MRDLYSTQILPRKLVLLPVVDHADCTGRTRQHEILLWIVLRTWYVYTGSGVDLPGNVSYCLWIMEWESMICPRPEGCIFLPHDSQRAIYHHGLSWCCLLFMLVLLYMSMRSFDHSEGRHGSGQYRMAAVVNSVGCRYCCAVHRGACSVPWACDALWGTGAYPVVHNL